MSERSFEARRAENSAGAVLESVRRAARGGPVN